MKLRYFTIFFILCILIIPILSVKIKSDNQQSFFRQWSTHSATPQTTNSMIQNHNHIFSAKTVKKTSAFNVILSDNHTAFHYQRTEKSSGSQDGHAITNAISIFPGNTFHKELEAHETIYFCTFWQQNITCDISSNPPQELSCFLLSDAGENLNCQRQIRNNKIIISYHNPSDDKGQYIFIKITNERNINQKFELKLYDILPNSQKTQEPKNTPSAPKRTKKPESTPSAPKQTKKPDNTSSSPKQTKKPDNTSSSPKQTKKPDNTSPAPKQTKKPDNTSPSPKQTKKPDNTSSAPKQTKKPDNTPSTPKQTIKLENTPPTPKRTSKPKNNSHSSSKQTIKPENNFPIPKEIINPDNTATPVDTISPCIITPLPTEALIPNTTSAAPLSSPESQAIPSPPNQIPHDKTENDLTQNHTSSIPPLEEHFLKLKINDSYQLTISTSSINSEIIDSTATINDLAASNEYPIIWSSTNPEIVSVEQGRLEVHNTGTAIIYCHYPKIKRGSSCFVLSS